MTKSKYAWAVLGAIFTLSIPGYCSETCSKFNELFDSAQASLEEGIKFGQTADPIAAIYFKLEPKKREITAKDSDKLYENSQKAEQAFSMLREKLIQIDNLIPSSPANLKRKTADESKNQALHFAIGIFLESSGSFSKFLKNFLMMPLMKALTCDMDEKLPVCQANALYLVYYYQPVDSEKKPAGPVLTPFANFSNTVPGELSKLREVLTKGLDCPKQAEKPQE